MTRSSAAPTVRPHRPPGPQRPSRVVWSIAVGIAVLAAASAITMARSGDTRVIVPSQASLSDNEVARLFDRPLPGVSDPKRVPTATGNKAADEHIAQVAVERGYIGRGNALDPLGSYQGRNLQQRAIDDLIELQAAMTDEIGTSLTLTSGHRGPAHQRRLFRSQLATSSLALRGRLVTNYEIALGLVDDVLNHAMGRAAPPGFSRHHTGLTIDVASGGRVLFAFATTSAYQWLTRDGYANAMEFGWIPSYPSGASGLGPDPEPWEWVWIGRGAARCALEGSCVDGGVDEIGSQASGWTLQQDGRPAGELRMLSVDGSRRLDPVSVTRFDVAVAFGIDEDLGFSAAAGAIDNLRWACVEARNGTVGPWNPVGCVELD